MSFDKLDLKDNNAREGRACLILCNIGGKELKAIKNYASLLGIRDMITVYSKNTHNNYFLLLLFVQDMT